MSIYPEPNQKPKNRGKEKQPCQSYHNNEVTKSFRFWDKLLVSILFTLTTFSFQTSASIPQQRNERKSILSLQKQQQVKRIDKNHRQKNSTYMYPPEDRHRLKKFKRRNYKSKTITFDIPVTYNARVKTWIRYFQGNGKAWFTRWLSRSHRYIPSMKRTLKQKNIPQDLAYIAMIESGFSPHAVSSANAVGYWQFIKTTANRYGLKTYWWLDERRDYRKSTRAAAQYLNDLYKMFGSWYLTAAAYNMGEGRLKRLIRRHKTKNFWILSSKSDFPRETRDYIPKLLAALMISKTPRLYGFSTKYKMKPHRYVYIQAPGGTDLINMAKFTGVPQKQLTVLNPELVKGFIPRFITSYRIRIPKGFSSKASKYIRTQIN